MTDADNSHAERQIAKRMRQKLAYVSGCRPVYTLRLRIPADDASAQVRAAFAEFAFLDGTAYTVYRAAQAIANAINGFAGRP